MKAFLMDAGRDFDIDADLPVNARDLAAGLGLDILLDAMAAGDKFLRKAAERGLHAGLASPAEISYRQHVLADCVARPATVRELYNLAVEAMEAERKIFGFMFRDSPDTILHRSRQVMEIQLASLRRLADITRREQSNFRSEGFTRLFGTLDGELTDGYFAEIQAHLGELTFKRGTMMSARLGKGSKGTGYVLRRQPPARGWRDLLAGRRHDAYSFTVPERDEARFRALSELTSWGVDDTANAVAQATDHVRGFFAQLRAELGFYLGCLNLRDRLLAAGMPVCYPVPFAPREGRLTARGLYDAGLALTLDDQRVVGNDIDADGRPLIMITGANHGGLLLCNESFASTNEREGSEIARQVTHPIR